MTSFLLPAVILIVLAVAAVVAKAVLERRAPTSGRAAYRLRSALLSPAERSFAGALESALPDGVSWFAKVRLGDVFEPTPGLSQSVRTGALNRIQQKHVDFVLVRSADLSVLGAIELDDSSHDQLRRKQRDAFVDEVFRSASVPLLHISAQARYDVATLRAKLQAELH